MLGGSLTRKILRTTKLFSPQYDRGPVGEASSPFLGGVGKTQNYSYFCDSSPSTPRETYVNDAID